MTEAKPKTQFQLQFSPDQIGKLASEHTYDFPHVFETGDRIAQGEHTRRNLETIFRWKTGGRGVSRLSGNTDPEVAEALDIAVHAKTERTAVAVLIGLRGVNVPVASAILTCIDQQRYTMIDFRALEALGTSTRPLDQVLSRISRLLSGASLEAWRPVAGAGSGDVGVVEASLKTKASGGGASRTEPRRGDGPRMIKKPGRCIFCNGRGLSKEHMWPDWLKAYIPRPTSTSRRAK